MVDIGSIWIFLHHIIVYAQVILHFLVDLLSGL